MEYVSSVERIGFRKGMQEGMQKGSLALLCRQISRRFNVSPNHVRSMLEGLGTSEIEELGERLFDAKSLEEIREWAEKKRQVQ